MHLGMFDDLWSAASLVPFAREDGLDVFLIGNRNCPPFVRGLLTCCDTTALPFATKFTMWTRVIGWKELHHAARSAQQQ